MTSKAVLGLAFVLLAACLPAAGPRSGAGSPADLLHQGAGAADTVEFTLYKLQHPVGTERAV